MPIIENALKYAEMKQKWFFNVSGKFEDDYLK